MDTIKYLSVRTARSMYLVQDAYKKASKYKGWKITSMTFSWLFNQMVNRGFLQPHFEEVTTQVYEHTPSKSEKLTHKILDAIHNYQRDFNVLMEPDKYVIVMGEPTFFELVKGDYATMLFFNEPVAFKVGPLYYQDSYRGRQIMNFKVHVVPGIDGFVILPKAIIEKR